MKKLLTFRSRSISHPGRYKERSGSTGELAARRTSFGRPGFFSGCCWPIQSLPPMRSTAILLTSLQPLKYSQENDHDIRCV